MAGSAWNKSRRMSSNQSSPRGAGPQRSCSDAFIGSVDAAGSPTTPSPPRRRNAIRNLVIKAVRPPPRSTAPVPEYRGVRYREELNKYVTEIRPSRSDKKIWLGTYDTAEEAARAFDIGNLCCKKNLPLNFPDSPRMLKRISSQLSPDEARSAIAKLAKEVARVFIHGGDRCDEIDRAAAIKAHELVQIKAEEPPQLQAHHFEAASSTVTYTENFAETILVLDEDLESATPMALDSGTSWSFTLGEININDDLEGIPGLGTPDFGTFQGPHGDVYYFCN